MYLIFNVVEEAALIQKEQLSILFAALTSKRGKLQEADILITQKLHKIV